MLLWLLCGMGQILEHLVDLEGPWESNPVLLKTGTLRPGRRQDLLRVAQLEGRLQGPSIIIQLPPDPFL